MSKVKDILGDIKLTIGLIAVLLSVIGWAINQRIQLINTRRDIEELQEANIKRKDETKTIKSIVVGIIWRLGKDEEKYEEWLINLTE